MPTRPIEDRFWEKVEVGDGCWEWKAGLDGRGYGQIHYEGRHQRAHRISWMLNCGPIPAGLWVLHHCDNPLCVNPEHLYLGTRLDNIRDMMVRGRKRTGSLTGESNPGSRLKAVDLPKIRAAKARGDASQVIADRFGVCRQTISNVLAGRTWVGI